MPLVSGSLAPWQQRFPTKQQDWTVGRAKAWSLPALSWSHISLICKTEFDKSTCLWLAVQIRKAAYGGPGTEPVPKQVHKECAQSATSFSTPATHILPRSGVCWALLREHSLYPICSSHGPHPNLTLQSSLGAAESPPCQSFLFISI